MMDFWVSSIVSARDKQPYIQLANEKGMLTQMSMAEARMVALDILQLAARAEADAMLLKFFEIEQLPEGVGVAMMANFRDFRAQLDAELVDRKEDNHAG